MLTSNLLRVRYARDRIVPHYLNTEDAAWQEVAEQMLELFRGQTGKTRGEFEAEFAEVFGDDPGQLVHQGLAKLLEDRCEFETVSGHPPEAIRSAIFHAAAKQRTGAAIAPFDRASVLHSVSESLGLTAEQIDQGLFADLKSEQKLVEFDDLKVEQLLQRYNVALAQGVLLRAVRVQVIVRNESPRRYRQLLRYVKFHRLICEIEKLGPESYKLLLDGPLSLFSATQKYGLQLALFLPAVLLCADFELRAELLWSAQKKPKNFVLTQADGLVSHATDSGMYVPQELRMFVELFRKRVDGWDISEETEIMLLGDGFWVPDFRLVHQESGKVVLLEVLGFWRKSSAEKHLERLHKHATEPFLLAVSDQLHIEDGELAGLPAGIHRFRNMPLPDEIARLAAELIASL